MTIQSHASTQSSAAIQSAAIPGLHHVTAIAGDAQRNVDFYVSVLGLRLVKRTVNFDDPSTYHLYYGDTVGSPGSIMTFFPWRDLPQGRVGLGQVVLTQYAVPRGSLPFWTERLDRLGRGVLARETLFGETRLVSLDPDGLPFALVEAEGDASFEIWATELDAAAPIPQAFAITGFYGVTLALGDGAGVGAILTDLFGYTLEGETDAPGANPTSAGRVLRFRSAGPGGVVDIHEAPGMTEGRDGAGVVHHVAFSTPNRQTQAALRDKLVAAGHAVTQQIDRDYFWAIYFRTPGGVLFEVATDEPGFERDEPRADLGTGLKLPTRYEPVRDRIEAALPPLSL